MQSNKKVSERGSVENYKNEREVPWWDRAEEKTEEVDGNKSKPDCEEPCKDCTCDTSTVAQHSAWDEQIGGDHYKDFAIQPTEFIMKNKLNFLEGCIIKRICRYKKKGDALTDLKKIKHEVDLIIELGGY